MIQALVFGGAFNPPTIAHIEVVNAIRKTIGYDLVVFVPSKQSYIQDVQKKDYAFSNEERFRMLEEIAKSRDWMMVSDYELNLDHQPKSYETLCHLRSQGIQGKLLFGSDKLCELEHGWMFVDALCKEFGIVVMMRNHDDVTKMIEEDPYLKSLKPYMTLVETPDVYQGVSSSQVRALLADFEGNQNELKELLLEEVIAYIAREAYAKSDD